MGKAGNEAAPAPPTSATRAPTSSGARGTGAALAMPFADTAAMQLHLDEIARTVARGAQAVLNIFLIFLPSPRPIASEPSGEHLTVPARQLALQPRLRDLLGDHRRLRRLAKPHGLAARHRLDRNTPMGPHRSKVRAVGTPYGKTTAAAALQLPACSNSQARPSRRVTCSDVIRHHRPSGAKRLRSAVGRVPSSLVLHLGVYLATE